VNNTDVNQIITIVIFIFTYILIFSGKIERTAAALIGLFLMLSAGYIFGFMNFEHVLIHVDWEVIILLFGMMTYVGLMAKTGFFKYVGIRAVKLAKGKPWLIFLYLSLLTAFISMAVDNVTTILLMIPITIEVAEILEINPIPVLLSEALLSNIGGVGTLVGDPPNIMIGLATGYSFNDFVIHLFPPVLVSLFIGVVFGKIFYRKWVKTESKNLNNLMKLNPKEYIANEKMMRYLLVLLFGIIFFLVIGGFFNIPAAFVALAGGTLALLISMEDPKKAFESVEWSTLVFFIALYSLVGGLYETHVLQSLATSLLALSGSIVILAIILLWTTGLLSAVVDNIPITAALIPVVAIMANTAHGQILWWALALGAGLGGNITPIGSSAGVIMVSLSSRFGHEISFKEWIKYGGLLGVGTLGVATLFLLFFL
jgi:Na+/H+ antiporter NhaD/arsenite permease-like protein